MKTCNSPNKNKRGPDQSEMRKVAEAAGLSRHQMYTDLAIAEIPEEEFEKLVESENPPTVTELARIGRDKPKRNRRRLTQCPHCGEKF